MTSSDTDTLSAVERVQLEHERFRTRYLQVAIILVSLVALGLLPLILLTDPGNPTLYVIILALALFSFVFWLTLRGRGLLAANLFLYGLLAASLGGTLPDLKSESSLTTGIMSLFAIVVGAFLLDRRGLIVLGLANVLAVVWVVAASWQHLVLDPARFGQNAAVSAMLPAITVLTCLLFLGHFQSIIEAQRNNVRDIERVMEQAKRIAQGDLSGDVEGDGDVPEVVRSMLAGLRQMVSEIRRTVASLASASSEIAAMARQQETGSLEQASAVQEIQQTLNTLAAASAEVEEHSREVARAAGKTEATHAVISEHISELTGHTRRIGELLEVIKDIANKSEILALNASLEGAKAGDAGRGFSLVAGQMQRLAESVMDSVVSVKAITTDVRESTNTTVMSTEQGAKIATATAQAATKITTLTEKQRAGTEQVTAAMEDISGVARQVSAGTSQTLAATKDLSQLSDELSRLVAGFQLPEHIEPRERAGATA
jgi:methyl-accepting chemotaxis protein